MKNSIKKITMLAFSIISLTAKAQDSLYVYKNGMIINQYKLSEIDSITFHRTKFNNNNNNHYVGEFYGGGIVFHVFDNGQHGLITTLNDFSIDDIDYNYIDGFSSILGINTSISTSSSDGATNTQNAIEAGAKANTVVAFCNSYQNDNYSDWYLPSIEELIIMGSKYSILQTVLNSDEDPLTYGFRELADFYYSSTMIGENVQIIDIYHDSKTEPRIVPVGPYYFKPIRSF